CRRHTGARTLRQGGGGSLRRCSAEGTRAWILEIGLPQHLRSEQLVRVRCTYRAADAAPQPYQTDGSPFQTNSVGVHIALRRVVREPIAEIEHQLFREGLVRDQRHFQFGEYFADAKRAFRWTG